MMNTPQEFPALLQQFFVDRLIQQRNASPGTIASYRDTFRLFLGFIQQKLRKEPTAILLKDLDPDIVLSFLKYLEVERNNTIRSRNARLAALRSFFRYAAIKNPQALDSIHGVLAIPFKRFERPLVGFLLREEIDALLEAPNPNTWCGQRDRIMLLLLYNTGARVSELINMKRGDVELTQSPSVRIHGKGRKERIVPVWKSTATQLRYWLRQLNQKSTQYLIPNRSGGAMSRTGINDRLQLAVKTAALHCPQIKKRRVTPHLIRHTTACHLLQAGVDIVSLRQPD